MSADTRVVYANDHASEILERGLVLSVKNNYLVASTNLANERLCALVLNAGEAKSDATSSKNERFTSAAVGDAHSLDIMFRPLLSESITRGQLRDVMISFHDLNVLNADLPELFASLYGLTEKEALLGALLSGDISLGDAATRLGVSLSTARSHLQHLFLKTDTHRQSELVRRLSANAALY